MKNVSHILMINCLNYICCTKGKRLSGGRNVRGTGIITVTIKMAI